MKALETDESIRRHINAEELGACPVCGAEMMEIDRLNEGRYCYIWSACSRQDCDGQWLHKQQRFSQTAFNQNKNPIIKGV